MKKELLIVVMFSLLILPTLILAGPEAPSGKDIWAIITSITNIVYGVLLAVAVVFIIVAGIRFISAGGDPEKVKGARDTVLWALVGIVVATAAVGLVQLMKNL